MFKLIESFKAINWKVRFRNPVFLKTFIAQMLLVLQMIIGVAHDAGWIDFQLTDVVNHKILVVVDAILSILGAIGVLQDPTSKGIADDVNTRKYEKPIE